jgi:hypothetical protein
MMTKRLDQQFNGKITKAKFEDLILGVANGRDVSACRYNEDGAVLTLYYIADAHAGTWQKSGAIIFTNETIQAHIDSDAALKAKLGL